ncbi:MAG: dephospho-CoA kinase, partial [Lachnospiraceae bacterium]
CDEIWYVYADPQVRIERLAKSRGYTLEKSRQIMRNQLTDREYRKKCKFMIDNSSDIVENTYEQIDKGLVEHGFL